MRICVGITMLWNGGSQRSDYLVRFSNIVTLSRLTTSSIAKKKLFSHHAHQRFEVYHCWKLSHVIFVDDQETLKFLSSFWTSTCKASWEGCFALMGKSYVWTFPCWAWSSSVLISHQIDRNYSCTAIVETFIKQI